MNKLPNTVLMVEDDQAVYKLFTYVLKKEGLEIVLFSKGNEACEWAKKMYRQ
jgi:DNA-binding response OmpR family regulator